MISAFGVDHGEISKAEPRKRLRFNPAHGLAGGAVASGLGSERHRRNVAAAVAKLPESEHKFHYAHEPWTHNEPKCAVCRTLRRSPQSFLRGARAISKSAFGVDHEIEKGAIGRVRYARAVGRLNRLVPPDYMRASTLTGMSRRDTRKVADAAGRYHGFQNKALQRATAYDNKPKPHRLNVVATARRSSADKDFKHTLGRHAPGLDMAMGTDRGTNGVRDMLERGSTNRHAVNTRHVQQALSGRRGGKTLYRGMSGVHLNRGDVHDAGPGASWTTHKPRAEHFARSGGRMQGNQKYQHNDNTPVMLKVRRASRRAVPVADRTNPEHFMGGQFKVVRTRQRNGITQHTVKPVRRSA